MTAGFLVYCTYNVSKTTLIEEPVYFRSVLLDDLDGLVFGYLNLQPAGRIAQITIITVNFIVGGLATEREQMFQPKSLSTMAHCSSSPIQDETMSVAWQQIN